MEQKKEIVINEKKFIVKNHGDVFSIEREYMGVIRSHIFCIEEHYDSIEECIKQTGKFPPKTITFTGAIRR